MPDDRNPGRLRRWYDKHVPLVGNDHPWAEPSRADKADGRRRTDRGREDARADR